MASAHALRAARWGAGPLLVLTVAMVALPAPLRPAVAQVRKVRAPLPNAELRMSQPTAVGWLRAHGIAWRSNGKCSDRQRPDCTSFVGLRWGSLLGLTDFKNRSHCPIMVSGGTEAGHAKVRYSHWNGYKMDIMPTACVTAFIEHHFRPAGIRLDGSPMFVGPNNYTYADEHATHWDIVFTAAWHPSDHDMKD